MAFVEAYTRAVGSSNLKCDEYHSDTDKLAAAALSGDLGSLIFRVKYANDASSYSALLNQWCDMVKIKAALRGWPIDISVSQVAKLSLNHFLNDICEHCGGKGYQAVSGVPQVMSDIPCKCCSGSGTKKVAAKKDILQYVEDMAESLADLSRTSAQTAMRKLSSEMNL